MARAVSDGRDGEHFVLGRSGVRSRRGYELAPAAPEADLDAWRAAMVDAYAAQHAGGRKLDPKAALAVARARAASGTLPEPVGRSAHAREKGPARRGPAPADSPAGRLRAAREAAGWTRQELARRACCDARSVESAERGHPRAAPGGWSAFTPALDGMARALGLSRCFLLRGHAPAPSAHDVGCVAGCGRPRRFRGLCGVCGTLASRRVAAGKATWATLEASGESLPPRSKAEVLAALNRPFKAKGRAS